MKKRRIDIQQNILLTLLRPLVYIWMRFDSKRKVFLGEGVSFKRKEPYIMLANHTFMFDVIHVPLRFRKVPFIVANQTLFKKKATKFLVSQVAHVISKQKGQSDTSTVRDLISAVKRGYPILIFPEGDTTFFGETGYIEESTMKLIKKLEIDVITCNVRGGYLSKPRWATSKRKNRYAEFHYELTIPKEKVKEMSVDEINETVKKALYHNAYTFQKEHMIKHPGKHLAEGLEDLLYVCPVCKSLHSLETSHNDIICKSCQTKGYVDDYGLIQGFPYDNLLEWNQFQRQFVVELRNSSVHATAHLYFINEENLSMESIGPVQLLFKNHTFFIEGSYHQEILVKDITNPTLTMRRDFSFFYQNRNYLLKMDHYAMVFLRIAQDKY
ncbi:MAG: 1-acyl-sn-glycerol-3-phosphate acyltransferase [Acholeplasmataceae bacterium]|jgi:1-acyl-sn-glycerol-3-phosphate acyltransferase|nr:1-acyl-sn-glycerol-3-phosphate acyltransferase [Acholeplasmataceae bacterium]